MAGKSHMSPNNRDVSQEKISEEIIKALLLVNTNKKKIIAKKIAKFEFEHDERKTILNGSKITYKSEDRIKKSR